MRTAEPCVDSVKSVGSELASTHVTPTADEYTVQRLEVRGGPGMSSRRKHVTQDALANNDLPEAHERIMCVVSLRGSNLVEVRGITWTRVGERGAAIARALHGTGARYTRTGWLERGVRRVSRWRRDGRRLSGGERRECRRSCRTPPPRSCASQTNSTRCCG